MLFQIMDGLMKRSLADDSVYAFMDKKRAEGKSFAYKKLAWIYLAERTLSWYSLYVRVFLLSCCSGILDEQY